MILIVGDRGTGKTTELIRMATVENDYKYIVCPNKRMVDCTCKMARDMGIGNMLYPVTLEELPFHNGFLGHVIVDEPTMLLERIIGAPIDAMAIHAEEIDLRVK